MYCDSDRLNSNIDFRAAAMSLSISVMVTVRRGETARETESITRIFGLGKIRLTFEVHENERLFVV